MSADFKRSSPIWRACAGAVVAIAVMIPVTGAFLKAQQTAPGPQNVTVIFGPTSAEGQVQTGMAMLKAGNPLGAEEAFRMAHELDPKNQDALMGLVEALMAQGLTDRTIEFLKREAAQSGGRADLHMALGNVAVRAGKYDLALTEFQTVLDTLDQHRRCSPGDGEPVASLVEFRE